MRGPGATWANCVCENGRATILLAAEPWMRTGDMESFVAYPSTWRRALLALAGLGFFVLGLWMVGSFGSVPISRRFPYVETQVAGWACLALSGLSVIAYIPKLFETGEQLRIDASGIRYPQWSDTTISWAEIRAITTWNYRRSRFIILHLYHPRSFPGEGLAALMAGVNRGLTGGDICISLTGTDRGYDEAMTAIDRFGD